MDTQNKPVSWVHAPALIDEHGLKAIQYRCIGTERWYALPTKTVSSFAEYRVKF